MKFRTEIELLHHQGLLSHSDSILMLGSCFTTSVGEKLCDDGFDMLINPFGALYNPASIAMTIERMVSRRQFDKSEAISYQGMFHSMMSHNALSSPDLPGFIDTHNEILNNAADFLRNCTCAIITLGTAWVFSFNATNKVVANCHKMPASLFTRSRLSVDECRRYISDIIEMLRSVNPDMKIIFTVSPIRHTADELHGNMLSKSTLLLAIDSTISGEENCYYFPSFEIMLDDLRDYRFYDSDMRHPSTVAVDYIYERFRDSFFFAETKEMAEAFRRLQARTRHRTINKSDNASETFDQQTMLMAAQLAMRFPILTKSINRICHID